VSVRPQQPTWVDGAAGGPYDADNLPYAVFATGDGAARVGVRVGDLVVDVAPLAAAGEVPHGEVFGAPSMTPLMALGRGAWSALRGWLVGLLTDPRMRRSVEPWLLPVDDVQLVLPFPVADYVDFYSSLHHATLVGQILRPGADPLPRQWRRLPIGYHGRSGAVVVSGAPVHRPRGLRPERTGASAGPDADVLTYAATQQLDFEAELAFAVGVPTEPASRVSTAAFGDHVFGVQLLNDWSARDIQRYESAPLGPFLGKAFATTVAAWVTPLDALAAAWVPLPGQDPAPAAHLRVDDPAGLDIDIEIAVNGETLARVPYASTYWAPAQMLAHLTSGGAPLRTGDVFASGTVSGPEPDRRGCLLELTLGGTRPLTLPDGSARGWLVDGDEVVLTASAPGSLGGRLALGETRGRIDAVRTAQ
jgi:fumarylacetoacetase